MEGKRASEVHRGHGVVRDDLQGGVELVRGAIDLIVINLASPISLNGRRQTNKKSYSLDKTRMINIHLMQARP